MHYNCLIIDDEIDLAKMTCEYFQMFDVTCAYVENSKECLKFLKENKVDIILLDINLSEESGFDLCKKIRENWDVPILFISARQTDDDVLIALNIGGDDYIKKPYTLSVLLAKVKVMLKRLSVGKKAKSKEESDLEKDGVLHLDKSTFCVYVNGRRIPLKAKEFSLLECLFERRNTIVTKEKLFDTVWGDTYYSDGTLNVHIRRRREKIEENPNEPKLIKTIWGTGYILETNENEN